jgi:FKBP-type peptidyl-prolyl cis-trans isomerase SlyD
MAIALAGRKTRLFHSAHVLGSNKVVTIDYTLTDNEGTVIDTSNGEEPMSYIQGIGNLIPGLESALEGKSAGRHAASVRYGLRDEALMQVMPMEAFEGVGEVEVGMQFRARTAEGTQILTVVEVDGDNVTVDGNHPLAGLTLNFDVAVRDVRYATDEELNHGHAHGPEGHEH